MRFQGEPGEPFAMREGLSGKEREEVRWYVEEFMDLPEGGNSTRAEKVEKLLESHGRWLWSELAKSSDVQAWLVVVQAQSGGRIELRAATMRDEVAFRSPWELMRAGKEPGKLIHALGVDVVRRVNAVLPALKTHDTSKGLRILAVVCRPDDVGFLDPRYTPEAMLDALAERPEVSIDFCRPATLAGLTAVLRAAQELGEPYHVVHFDGHGTTIPELGGVGALCFEQADGSLDLVQATHFGDLMAAYHVPLVVLEACRTAKKTFAQDTVAGALLRQGVGSVLAMGHAVHVDMTRELLAAFYGAIARGQPIGAALRAGRERIDANRRRHMGSGPDAPSVELQDWFVPQLYQGGEDTVLLPKKPASKKSKRVEPVFAGFLPEPRAGFQGRGHVLHRLERAISTHRIVVVHAPGGIGKTALAREAAQWWIRTKLFPDGTVFVSFEGNPSAEAVIQQVGESLEGVEFHKRENRATWLATELEKRRMLLVWDNYESVLPAFRGGEETSAELAALATRWTAGKTRILVTCRDGEVRLDGAWPFPLDELSKSEGLLLLARMLERLGIDRQERVKRGWISDVLEPIVVRTGGHPLAIELLAPQVVKLGPERVADELEDCLAKASQQHTEARNRSMAASLDFSIRHLSEESHKALPAVALLSGGCLEVTAQHVVGLEPTAWAKVCDELERTGLLRVVGPVLRPHPVLADAKDLGPDSELSERFVAVLSAFCAAFDQSVQSPKARAAMTCLALSEVVVGRAVNVALDMGKSELAWRIANSLRNFLEWNGRAGDGRRLIVRFRSSMRSDAGGLSPLAATLAREAAVTQAESGDADGAARELVELIQDLEAVNSWDAREELARTLAELGRVHYETRGRPTDSLAPLQRAEELFTVLEREKGRNSNNRGAVLGERANALMNLGRIDEALAVAEQALGLAREEEYPLGIARGTVRIAQFLMQVGRHAEAEARYGEAIVAAEQAGDAEIIGDISQALGGLLIRRGRPNEAIGQLRKALAASQRSGNGHHRLRTLNLLGDVEYSRKNYDGALAWFQRSFELADKLGDTVGRTQARSNRAVMLSKKALESQDPALRSRLLHEAIAEDREILSLNQQIGNPPPIQISHTNLASNLQLVGELDEAEHHAQSALSIGESIRSQEIWRPLGILEYIAGTRGNTELAAQYRTRKEAVRAEAQRLAGTPSLPTEMVTSLLQFALQARMHRTPLGDVLTTNGVPVDFLNPLRQHFPWLATHLEVLATSNTPRPAIDVPDAYADLIDQAWQTIARL